MLDDSLYSLHNYCKKEDYKGWDVFDGLKSRLFRSSPFYCSKLFRIALIQFFKHSPVNFRIITIVPKDYNSKGLALFAAGLISLGKNDEAISILERLKDMSCSGYSATCWGYNFDWQARAFYVPAGKPNMVATVFVANTFLDYAEAKSKEQKAKSKKEVNIMKIVEGACEFILKELVLFEDEEKLCFGYIPGEQARVHNANMLGAALMARVYSHTKNADYYEKSKKAMAYSIKALNPDYSWPYGELPHHRFIDNFHTGYNLVALKEWMDYTENNTWKEELRNAYKYFLDTFWLEDGCPKYYNNSLYPIDIHCSAQGIVTCLKLKNYDNRSVPMAKNIAKWAIDNMQDKEGYFYYQKTRYYTNKIPYMRWSQAWMCYALSKLSHECHE
jgi:hypothetical protein